MSLLGRQAREIPYDDSEPILEQDPNDANHWTYSSPHPPLRVQVERGMRGTYGWSISFEGMAEGPVLATIAHVDLSLRRMYGQP